MDTKRQTRKPAPAKQSAARGRRSHFFSDWPVLIAFCVILLAGAILLERIWPDGFPIESMTKSGTDDAISEIHSDGPLRLNELMASNAETIKDSMGKSPDWIEVMNVGKGQIDLEGYTIAKKSGSTNVFSFPDATLGSGESVIVFADGALQNGTDDEWHAPFRLSGTGGTLMLFNSRGAAVDTVNFPALDPDQSYVRVSQSAWEKSMQPTPGLPNTQENWDSMHAPMEYSDVEISELLASNSKYAPDENGLYQDYIELHNKSSETVDLSGWFLSDNPDKLMQWKLPDGFVLGPGECKIVYASGQDKDNKDYPHASFGLSTEGETVTLTDPNGRIADQVTYDLLKTDQAWSRDQGGNWALNVPTPGSAN